MGHQPCFGLVGLSSKDEWLFVYPSSAVHSEVSRRENTVKILYIDKIHILRFSKAALL